VEYSTRAYDLTQKMEVLDEQAMYVWDTHGWALVQSGKVREGTEILRKAAEQANFPEVHLHLASAYMRSGNVEDLERASYALDTARKIIERLEAEKKPIDPTVRPKYDQLSAELDGKRRLGGNQAG
jgi:predicted Zn-dependent protease